MNDAAAARETSEKVAARILDALRLVARQRSALQDYRFVRVCAISIIASLRNYD